jgi:predicted ATPase
MASVFVVRPAPQIMRAESRRELKRPDLLMEDFASWLRYLMQEHQGRVYELTSVLRRVIPRFSSFSLREAGDARMLHVEVRSPGDALDLCRFDSLSHGERMLIALYTLLGCMPDEDVTICIDEPENFLALPEVQPWLDALRDRLEEHDTCQALLVSHHPRLINFLTAAKAGVWLSRKGDLGPSNAVTVSPDASKDGIPVADLIERGWLYDA